MNTVGESRSLNHTAEAIGVVSIPSMARDRGRVHRLWHLAGHTQWAAIDAILAFASMLIGFWASPTAGNVALIESHLRPYYSAGIFALVAFLSSYVLGLSHYPNLRSQIRIVVLTFLLTMVVSAGLLVVSWFVFYKQIGRYIVGIAAGLFFVTDSSVRLLWFRLMTTAKHRIAVWSDIAFSDRFDDLLKKATFPVEVVSSGTFEIADLERLARIIESRRVHEIVVHGVDPKSATLLLSALNRGIAVSTMESFAERHFFKIPVVFIGPKWFFDVDLRQHRPFYDSAKRSMDFVLAAVGAAISTPFLLFGAMLIVLQGDGPILYSQMRVGKGGRLFRIWKLRTMRMDAENAGVKWAMPGDSRITWVGKFLRKTRIDELPQFWNILKGDMALVGPRPERPEFVDVLAAHIPFYMQRHLIKPGLTGWAQLCYPYGASEADAREKLGYDFFYLKNVSFVLDLQILLQTVGAFAKGAR